MLSQEIKFWNSEAAAWRWHVDLFGKLKEPIFNLLRLEVQPLLAELSPAANVLNLGSGSNNRAYLGDYPVRKPIALDFSPDMLALNQAKRKIQADVNRPLPLADNSIDLAVSYFLMRYLPEETLPKLAAELARVLKPGGAFLIADTRKNRFPHQKSEFRPEEFAEIAKSVGLREVVFSSTQLTHAATIPGILAKGNEYGLEIGIVKGRK